MMQHPCMQRRSQCNPPVGGVPRRRPTPDNALLLQTAMGAVMGQLTSIDELGQASMGFHGDPALMQHDPYRWAQHCGIQTYSQQQARMLQCSEAHS